MARPSEFPAAEAGQQHAARATAAAAGNWAQHCNVVATMASFYVFDESRNRLRLWGNFVIPIPDWRHASGESPERQGRWNAK